MEGILTIVSLSVDLTSWFTSWGSANTYQMVKRGKLECVISNLSKFNNFLGRCLGRLPISALFLAAVEPFVP